MQKWEYMWRYVGSENVNVPAGQKGLFGGEKTETETRLFGYIGERKSSLDEVLAHYGEQGWELVSAVVSSEFYITTGAGAASGWANLPHRLYFKRPKA